MRQLALSIVFAMVAAAAPPATPPEERTIRVPVSFASRAPDADLKMKDFSVLTDTGTEAKVLRVQSSDDELILLVVLDLVGDMALIAPARQALAAEIHNLPKTTWVGVLRAQDGMQVLVDPTPERDKVTNAILSMPTTGAAGLLDTIEVAARLGDAVAAKSGVRVAVLYVTDSDVRNYREDFTNPVINESDTRDLSRKFPEGLIREKISRLTDRLSARETPVFISHLWYSSERLNRAYQNGLMQVAAATGGTAVFARAQSEIPMMVSQTVTNAQAQYSIVVEVPPKADKQVNVVVQSGQRTLTYRPRFILR
jgi:hypothetical protein